MPNDLYYLNNIAQKTSNINETRDTPGQKHLTFEAYKKSTDYTDFGT